MSFEVIAAAARSWQHQFLMAPPLRGRALEGLAINAVVGAVSKLHHREMACSYRDYTIDRRHAAINIKDVHNIQYNAHNS